MARQQSHAPGVDSSLQLGYMRLEDDHSAMSDHNDDHEWIATTGLKPFP